MSLFDYEGEIVNREISSARRKTPQNKRAPQSLKVIWFLVRLAAGLAVFGLLSVIITYLVGQTNSPLKMRPRSLVLGQFPKNVR